MRRVCVVGAGVVGLSTALNILQTVPDVSLTVLADKFLSETTSSGAGGHFTPERGHFMAIPEEQFRQWVTASRDHFYTLACSSEAASSGMMLISGYHVSDHPNLDHLDDVVLHYRQLSQKELDSLGFKQRYGFICTSTLTEVTKYLKWLTSRIVQKGGTIKKYKLSSLNELAGQYDVVVNCCGLGAKELVGDENIQPVKGHIVRVRAPWIKMFYSSHINGIGTYVYPHSGIVNLGGKKEVGVSDLNPDPEVIRDIMNRTKELVPSLEGCEVVDTWVGLRPSRSPLRLETETLRVRGHEMMVVHNYGHSSLGITLSWGTAVEAAGLVRKQLDYLQSKL